MMAQQYWNDIGAKKVFEDPLYLDKLQPFLSSTAQIVEYGCGYGRMMGILKSAGYHNLIGFDFAPNMITRGRKENPDLDFFQSYSTSEDLLRKPPLTEKYPNFLEW